MNTEKVPTSGTTDKLNSPGINLLKKMRSTPLVNWFTDKDLSDRLSGTLKKNNNVGFKVFDQLRHEALVQTLGWTWESVQSSYVTFNDAVSEGDNHSITECGWFADRWISLCPFPEDIYELKYIIIADAANNKREGIGLICRQTSISWVQPGSLIFCLLAEYCNINKRWLPAQNPF